jgi:hypothetical protein
MGGDAPGGIVENIPTHCTYLKEEVGKIGVMAMNAE